MPPAAAQLRHAAAFGWLLWLVLALPAAAAPTVSVGHDFERIDLANSIDILTDPTGALTYADVTTPPRAAMFRPATLEDAAREPGKALWLRFALRNGGPSERLLLLRVQPAAATSLSLYSAAAPGGNENSALPAAQPAPTTPLFQLLVPAGTTALYYLRLAPGSSLVPQLELHTLHGLLAAQQALHRLDNISLGALCALLACALLALLLTRDTLYLWVAGYGFFNLCANSGNWLPLLAQLPRFDLLLAAQLLAVACTLRLSLRFPAYPEHVRGWRWALNLLLAVNVLAAVALLLPLPHDYRLGNGLLVVSILAAIAAALHAYLHGHQRLVLLYALLRAGIVLAGITIAFVHGSYLPERDAMGLLLAVQDVELAGLLWLALLRSFHRQNLHAQQQRAIAAAEAESRARTEVIAEVGHRIRTPVSGVLGMLEMLQDTPLSAMQSDYLGTIQRAGNELLNVVNDLGDLSKLGSQPGELQQTTFEPEALVAECIDGFRGLAGARKLELISDPAPDLPAYVSGDPTRLRQILLQLLHHAVSHCEAGELVLQLRALHSHWLHFEIRTDSRAPQQVAVSPMDQRLNPPGAAGLRLGVARQLADTLGGRLQVRSEAPGKLVIWFELPLPAAAAAAAPASQEPALRNKQLLVVDDSATFCEVLRRQAGHWGMVVHTAGSASEGLARLRNQITLGQPIDAVLVDADMQELEDGKWLERLRAEISAPPALILLASRPDLAGSKRLRRLGVRRVLLKPINHTSLKITLAEELSPPPAPLPKSPLNSAPLRCLVAEDNVINTKVLLGMLHKLGVECTAAANGQEAVEACQRQDYDIVLMDCDMPIMDGWEATRRIREIDGNRGRPATPIIALTANTVAELAERARQPLMDAHLVKPVHLLELQSVLERWTGKTVPLSPRPNPPEQTN
jgi:CheY-like chemotaxis protein